MTADFDGYMEREQHIVYYSRNGSDRIVLGRELGTRPSTATTDRLLRMRIAYVGNFDAEHSTENHVRIALEHNGHDVTAAPRTGPQLGPYQIQHQRRRHCPLDSDRRVRPRRPRPPARSPQTT